MAPHGELVPRDELCSICEKAYDSHDGRKMTIDTHVEQFLDERKITDQSDRDFVRRVIFGIDQYNAFLKSTANVFMANNHEAKTTDLTKYLIVSYLVMFRIHEYDISSFSVLVKKVFYNLSALYHFLRFLFNLENIQNVFMPEWQLVLERGWIESELLPKMFSKQKAMETWLLELENLLVGMNDNTQKKVASKPSTQPQPFNLTKPKVKAVPAPQIVASSKFKPRELPETTYTPEMSGLSESQKQMNRAKVEQIAKEAKPLFKSITSKKDAKAVVDKAKREEEQQRIEQELQAQKPKVKDIEEVKKILNKPAEVKLNAAAILREDVLYRKKQEQEAQILHNYEKDLRDTSRFDAWRQEMESKEEEERKLLVQKRKLEMMLADENARLARTRLEEDNRSEVIKYKEQTEKELEETKKLIVEQQQQKMKQVVEIVEQIKENAEEAKKRLVQDKRAVGRDRRKEKRKNEIKVAEHLELERQRKEEIIMQIKALENAPTLQFKQFDPTEMPGSGLLIEMSYAELQQRLQNLKEQHKQVEEEKRKAILEEQQAKRQLIMEKAEKIAHYRQLQKKEGVKQRAQKLKDELEEKERISRERDADILELQAKLQAAREKKIAEKERLLEEERQRAHQKQFLQADLAALEFKRWEQQELGAGRQAKNKNDSQIKQEQGQQVVAAREAKIRTLATKKANAEKEKIMSKYTQEIDKVQQPDARTKAAHDQVRASDTKNVAAQRQRKADPLAAISRADSKVQQQNVFDDTALRRDAIAAQRAICVVGKVHRTFTHLILPASIFVALLLAQAWIRLPTHGAYSA